MPTPHPTRRHSRSIALLITLVLVAGACGGGDDEADDATTTTATTAPETTTTEPPEEEPEEDEDADADPDDSDDSDDGDIPGGRIMMDDKSILLDGFVGVRIPDGWDITSAQVIDPRTAPAGETDLDPDALDQVLVINPVDEPRGASLALIHYAHSEAVPDLGLFTEAVGELLSGDGSQIGEPQAGAIGGQESFIHEVQSASGATGVMVTMLSGEDYFFILAIVSNPDYSDDVAAMLSSMSFEPALLPS